MSINTSALYMAAKNYVDCSDGDPEAGLNELYAEIAALKLERDGALAKAASLEAALAEEMSCEDQAEDEAEALRIESDNLFSRNEALLSALEEAAPDWLPESSTERANCIRDCALEFSTRLGRARAAIARAKGTP